MTVGTLLYEGKAKKIFTTGDPGQVLQYFKDDATAFNAQKRGTILEKGVVNNKISERLFQLLEWNGVPTHFIERKSDREMLTKKVTIVPVEVVVRDYLAGHGIASDSARVARSRPAFRPAGAWQDNSCPHRRPRDGGQPAAHVRPGVGASRRSRSALDQP